MYLCFTVIQIIVKLLQFSYQMFILQSLLYFTCFSANSTGVLIFASQEFQFTAWPIDDDGSDTYLACLNFDGYFYIPEVILGSTLFQADQQKFSKDNYTVITLACKTTNCFEDAKNFDAATYKMSLQLTDMVFESSISDLDYEYYNAM